MEELIDLTHKMVRTSGEIARTHYRTNFDVDHKSDASPVTIADRTIEQRLREMVEKARPADGFLGEEFGTKDSQNGLIWVVDPIDGTKSFVAGRPSFGTLIALWEGDTPLINAVYQPVTKELWFGIHNQPTTLNGAPVTTNALSRSGAYRIGSTAPSMFHKFPDLLPAMKDTSDFFVWGGDCYLYGMCAFGGLDMVIEHGLATYDYAAIPLIITGAGGYATDWHGNAMTLKSKGDFLCTANEAVRDEMLQLIADHS